MASKATIKTGQRTPSIRAIPLKTNAPNPSEFLYRFLDTLTLIALAAREGKKLLVDDQRERTVIRFYQIRNTGGQGVLLLAKKENQVWKIEED